MRDERLKRKKACYGAFFMRAGFLSLIAFCFFVLSASVAYAQNDDEDFDREFSAFQKKIEQAKNTDIYASSTTDETVENPLGPAANLPIAGGLAPMGQSALAPAEAMDIEAQMEEEQRKAEEKINRKTFELALKQLLPLTPEQIRATYEEFIKSRRAAEEPVRIPDKLTRVETISLDPSGEPLVVNLVPGYVTTLSILDASGAPWPVQDMSYAGKFQIVPPTEGEHIIRITPQTTHGVGNLSLRLVDLVTPVIFTLNAGLNVVDYRFDARVPKTGPLAKTSIIGDGDNPDIQFGGLNTVAGTDDALVAILEGIAPSGAKKLLLRGGDSRTSAWRHGGQIYLRTPLSLLSPAWNASVSSADGTSVYTLNDTPIVLLSENGKMVRVRLSAVDEVLP